MTQPNAASWRGLSYTALENMIVALHGAQPEAVRARFRKLRLRPFPDDIRAGQGKRVGYDLPRVLAILAVFELNALHIPQGHAVAIVEATWPEWCRAAIVAACDLGLIDRPSDMPAWAAATITILPDAFAEQPTAVAAYATKPDKRVATGGAPTVKVDATRLVAGIHAATPSTAVTSSAAAFLELETSHGWTRQTFPSQTELAKVARGRGFLEEGPFVDRALTLLDARLDKQGRVLPQFQDRLQAIADYLDDPAPVDAWMTITGTDAGSPRLGHLLQAWAVQIGLDPRKRFPQTVLSAAGADSDGRARRLLDSLSGV